MASIRGTIRLEGDAYKRVAEIAAMVKRPEALWKEVVRRGANEFRAHFVKRDGENVNKIAPGRREHVWLDFRSATGNPEIVMGGAEFAINDPRYATKVYGATIVPRAAKALTIPIHELGYARRPAVFEDETGHKLFRPKGKRVLMAQLATDADAVVIYVLAKSASIPKDPQAMPDEAKLVAACVDQAEKHLARVLAAGGN